MSKLYYLFAKAVINLTFILASFILFGYNRYTIFIGTSLLLVNGYFCIFYLLKKMKRPGRTIKIKYSKSVVNIVLESTLSLLFYIFSHFVFVNEISYDIKIEAMIFFIHFILIIVCNFFLLKAKNVITIHEQYIHKNNIQIGTVLTQIKINNEFYIEEGEKVQILNNLGDTYLVRKYNGFEIEIHRSFISVKNN